MPVWLTPDDVVGSLAAYEHNGEFRIWLSAISKLKTKGLAAIERLSSILIRDVPSRALGNAVDRFLRMREVHWWHLHHEWMRKSGALADLPADVRKAAFFDLWQSCQSGGALPWELDPGKACDERFEMRGKRKRSGDGWRTYYAFGIARRTRHKMVDNALKAASSAQYKTQFMYVDGGRLEAINEIARAVAADTALTHWAKLDVANCFDNISLARAHEALPVKRKVVQHTISINLEEACDRRENDHIQYYRNNRTLNSNHDRMSCPDVEIPLNCSYKAASRSFATRYPLLLPQGAACSPRVAYWLIERGLPPLHPAREFMYGDDLLILGRSETGVQAEASIFRNLFRRHAAGPLQIGSVELGAIEGGIDFLGIEVVRGETRASNGGHTSYAIETRVADEPRQRFLTRLHEQISRGLASGDLSLSEARMYLRGFVSTAPSQDHASLVSDACSLARASGVDFNILSPDVDED